MKFQKDEDYVIFYAKKLKGDARLFSQHKNFLESQLNASKSIFSSIRGKDFKKNARKYLKARGIIC